MIECLELTNFKSIKDGTFHLENLTLLTGLNGAGKSSTIQSMLLLRQAYEKHLLPKTGISLNGEYVQIGTGSDLLHINSEIDSIGIKLNFEHSSLSYTFEYKPHSDMLPVDKENIDNSPFEESLFQPGFQYLSADRISPKTTYDVSDYVINQQRSLGNKGEYTAHFLSENGDKPLKISALQHSKSTSDSLIHNLNAWMSEITPGTQVVAKLISGINQASLHYQFTSLGEKTPEFKPENTGFGLTYVLPIITAVLSSHPGDLLLIENPESHLHPAGQSVVAQLISLASQNGVQVIAETHSDHFLNGVRKAVKSKLISHNNVNIYFLSRNEKDVGQDIIIDEIRIEPNGRINSWPIGFFDEWENSLNELIQDI